MNDTDVNDILLSLSYCKNHYINQCDKCKYRNRPHCFLALHEDATKIIKEQRDEIENQKRLKDIAHKNNSRCYHLGASLMLKEFAEYLYGICDENKNYVYASEIEDVEKYYRERHTWNEG